MKRKNLIAIKKVKKKKLLFKNPKIQKFYVNFKSIIFKDIKYKSFAVAVSGGSDSLCLAYFSKIYSSEYGNKITVHHGPALKSLEQLKVGSFDMAFIDADKSNYREYYKHCMMLIRKGGTIILDNMLWSGSVIDPHDDDSIALRKTGDYIQKDKRVFNLLLPIRDGLMLCIKK